MAIGSVIEAFGQPPAPVEQTLQAPGGPTASAFDAAVQPALTALSNGGDASPGAARRWKRMMETYRHGTDRLAELGREALGSWQRFVRRTTHRGRDGPER